MNGFEFRKGSKNSLLSSKWSIGDKKYQSIIERSRSRESSNLKQGNEAKPVPPQVGTHIDSSIQSVNREMISNPIEKEKYLNTFGKKQDSLVDDMYNFEYSKDKDDTPDFDSVDNDPRDRDLLNRDMVILGY
jgi:hypothetical protein